MAPPFWVLHVETFVDPDKPARQQAASQDALVDLLVHKNLSMSEIVKEMGEFLTTTDTAIRARGILLLGELWTQLGGQPLEDTVVHTFAAFFASRLADWHALRGALVGSLALLKREKRVGSVQEEDAKLFVQSALVNLEVQALAQQDRMFCLELYECLLLRHARAVASVGGQFVDGVCAAVDGEKDPRCLLLAFHVVELVAKLFPDPDGPVGNLAEDLFSIMSCYFPISFNPPPDDTRGITREDLSTALMRCFASTKLFADFCIPLLLEKLSSSLRTAKRDSLKYMGYCSLNFGPEMFKENAGAIWNALKQELFPSKKPEALDKGERDEEIVIEALGCFTSCIKASQQQSEGMAEHMESGIFLQLVLQDDFVDDFFKCLPSVLVCKDCNDVPFTSGGKDIAPPGDASVTNNRASANIKETSRSLAAAVEASCSGCFVILNNVFKRLFEVVKVPIDIREADLLAFLRGSPLQHNLYLTGSLNMTVLEAILMIIEAAKKMVHDYINALKSSVCSMDTHWISPLQSCAVEVVMAFSLVIIAGLQNYFVDGSLSLEKIWQLGVAGLQAVASFPSRLSAISEEQFQFIISFLLGIIVGKFQVKYLWERAVEALAAICNVEEKFNVHRQGLTDLVAGSLLDEVLKDKPSLPVVLNLKALAAVCSQRQLTPTGILKKLTDVLCDNLREAVQKECAGAFEKALSILQGLSHDFLPSCGNTETENEAMLQVALGIWSVTESLPMLFTFPDSQILEASMEVLRIAILKCSEQSQRVFLSKTWDKFIGIFPTVPKYTSPRDVWMTGLFFSVLIALRPSIHTFQERGILPMLLATAICPPCTSVANVAAEAVASMLNKWHIQKERVDVMTDDTSFTATIDMILKGGWMPTDCIFMRSGSDTEKPCISHMQEEPLQVKLRGIHLLALIGKGLAMRGHIAVSDIAMSLLRLAHCDDLSNNQWEDDTLLNALWPNVEEVSAISFAAAEGLGFILKDSETSLNKDHHALIKPLYKQRFFVSMLPPLSLAVKEAGMSGRVMLYHAFGNLVFAVPSIVLLTEAAKVLPLLLESLSVLCNDQRHSDVLLSILLALSALLVDKNVWDISSQHVATITNRLLGLMHYSFSMMVRETALLCLGAVVALPYARVFPVRTQVLRALTNALDDPKRTVRREAIRCRRAWDAIAQ